MLSRHWRTTIALFASCMPQRDVPYLQPDGTLRNKLCITDQALLSLAEADLVAARAKLLELNLPRPPFSFGTRKAIHQELFQDVYTWAGQARTTPIGKRVYDDPTSRVQMFVAPDTIEARADALFRSLAERTFSPVPAERASLLVRQRCSPS